MVQKINDIPAITTEEMREVDRLMIEEFRIDLIRMMENAGQNLARLCKKMLAEDLIEKKVFVAVGRGNNGGGGLVAARYLHNWGAKVKVVIEGKDIIGVPLSQLSIIEKLDIEIVDQKIEIASSKDEEADIIIDSLIGYGLKGDPKGWVAQMIDYINGASSRIISLDAPSGLDATSGSVGNPCVKADWTMTLALPKIGLRTKEAKNIVGKLFLADIGVPRELYRSMGIKVESIFNKDTLIELK